jgi:hypothetical protein
MNLILIQILMAQTDLLTVLRHFVSCIILIPQAPNMSLKTSNTGAVWFITLTYPAHLPIM